MARWWNTGEHAYGINTLTAVIITTSTSTSINPIQTPIYGDSIPLRTFECRNHSDESETVSYHRMDMKKHQGPEKTKCENQNFLRAPATSNYGGVDLLNVAVEAATRGIAKLLSRMQTNNRWREGYNSSRKDNHISARGY